MTKLAGLLILISALLGTIGAPQNVNLKREPLSPKGQVAYDLLASACVFRIGSVGFAGVTSEEELALYDLLEEPYAVEALKSLVAEGSYEGGLYGLVGLSLKNNTEFNRAVDVYKGKQQSAERPKSNSSACQFVRKVTDEQVVTQSGCIVMRELRADVVTKIQSGGYDNLLLPKYRLANKN